MAKISFSRDKEYMQKLRKLEERFTTDEVIEKAVYKGAGIVTDAIRTHLSKIPTVKYRHLSKGEVFTGLSEYEKKDLEASFGLTKIRKDRNGFIHAKAGFDGYGSFPTRSYPKGVPNQLLARSVESGSTVRMKKPFVRPAVNASRKKAIETMEEVIDDELKKIF